MARSQVSTWWPVAPSDAADKTKNFTSGPPLDGYANKHWNGLVGDFYKPRVQCYVDQISIDMSGTDPEPTIDTANLTKCAVEAELTFTQGTGTLAGKKYSEVPTPGQTLTMSKALLEKYAKHF